jgi:hypothetical protein
MTCGEFLAFYLHVDPRKATVAERASIVLHYRHCRKCRDMVERRYQERLKAGEVSLCSQVRGAMLRAHDSADPEFRETINGRPANGPIRSDDDA